MDEKGLRSLVQSLTINTDSFSFAKKVAISAIWPPMIAVDAGLCKFTEGRGGFEVG